MSDYINIQEVIDRLSEVLSSEEEFEKAKQVIIETPTISETEIIRKAFERVVERLEEQRKQLQNEYLESAFYRMDELNRAIKIVKEECGING